MQRVSVFLLLLVAFILAAGRPASACSPIARDFVKYLSASRAVVHGRVSGLAENGTKARLQVLAYVGPGTAPSVIDLPRTELIRGGGNCPDLQLAFKDEAHYVVFLGDVPPNLRFADPYWTALRVDDQGNVRDMFNHVRAVPALLGEFAAGQGHAVLTPTKDAPRWGSGPAGVPVWMLVGGGALLLALFTWRRWRDR